MFRIEQVTIDNKKVGEIEYAHMMDRMKDQGGWDVRGIIADTSQRLLESGDGDAAAVIDSLVFSLRRIAERISHGHAKRIDPTTIREAADIASQFTVL